MIDPPPNPESAAESPPESFGRQVRRAVIWRSGSQILAQVVTWGATLAVVRLLVPTDYGLFAMTQTVMSVLAFMNGYGFASALVQQPDLQPHRVRQAFGILLALNVTLALVQVAIAPAVAAYYRQPELVPIIRVQCLVYLCVPFTALPNSLLSRGLDFRNQAVANLAAAGVSAGASLAGALSGLGVWTLVIAPIAGFWTRAVILTVRARSLVMPSFDWRGTQGMIGFGSAMLITQLLWVIQSQSDVLIGGRLLDPHALGIYTEGLFLTQIVVAKFVPPLNEVAFPAFARIRHGGGSMAWPFVRAVRMIMLITTPIFLGLAAVATPAVEILFGPKWHEMVGIIQITALAMPFVTLQVLFAPAVNALGRTDRTLIASVIAAIVFPACFLIGARYGATGLAIGWLVASPLLAVATAAICAPVIEVGARALSGAVLPALIAASAMAIAVKLADGALAGLATPIRLGALMALGGGVYVALLALFARAALTDVVAMLKRG